MLTLSLAVFVVGAGATPAGAASLPSFTGLPPFPSVAALTGHAAPVPFFGLGAEHGNLSDTQRAAELDRQAATGVSTMRENIRWDQIERSPGVYDFSRLDAIVKAMAAHRITMMPTLIYAPNFYTAKPAGATGSTQYPPKDPATLAAFATRLVKRYGTRGTLWCKRIGLLTTLGLGDKNCVKAYLPITNWQVWNEPDFPSWWATKPDANAYAALLSTVAAAIHKADRKAKVVAAGLTNKAFGSGYLNALYDAGAGKSFDMLALHPYGKTVSDEVDFVRRLRDVMVAHGDGAKQIEVTEYGWSDGGARSDFITSTNCQAALVYAVTRKFSDLRLQLGINSIFEFYWNDQPANGSKSWPFFAGMVRTDGSAKPVLAAFTAAVSDQPAPEGLTLEAACPPDRQMTG